MRAPGNPLIKGTFWLDDVNSPWLKPLRPITRHRVTLPMLVNRCSHRLDALNNEAKSRVRNNPSMPSDSAFET
jgi:hypothetical protein